MFEVFSAGDGIRREIDLGRGQGERGVVWRVRRTIEKSGRV